MAGDSRRRIVWNVAAAISVVLVFTAEVMVGQVVIRESVTIGDAHGLAKSLTTGDTLDVPSDGILMVRYTLADMIFSDFEPDATLHTTVNGLPFVDDTVTHHVGTADTTTYFCSALPIEIRFGNRFTYNPPADSAFVVGEVEEGDKIAFDYDGKKVSSYYTEKTGGSSWLGSQTAGGCQEGTTFYPYELITFDAILTPDTLSLEFDPSEDIFLPVPDTLIQVTAKVLVPADSVRFELLNDTGVYPAPDTTFTFDDSTTTSRSVIVQDGEASLNLRSFTYWGVAEVTGTAWHSGQPIAADTVRFPTDDDHDGIADVWEDSTGGTALADTFGVQNSADADWDWEWNPPLSMKNAGDGIPKIMEYQGVLIGEQHVRLRPQHQEVFIDTTMALYADWAAGEVESQLGIKVHRVAGAYSKSDPVKAPKKLKWLGDAHFRQEWYRNYVLVLDDSVRRKNPISSLDYKLNGDIFSSTGVYRDSSLNVNACGTRWRSCGIGKSEPISYGKTNQHLYEGDSVGYQVKTTARIFDGTIANVWSSAVNSINQSSIHVFWQPMPVSCEDDRYDK